MSIVNRLYRAARARVRSRFAKRGTEETAWEHERQMPPASQAGPSPPPRQDPVLAKYYANLEVTYGADLETVKKAWKRLVKKYHPDLHSNDPRKASIARELTQGLNEAYAELEKRLKSR